MSQRSGEKETPDRLRLASPEIFDVQEDFENICGADDDGTNRFNESSGPVKKRKTSVESTPGVAESYGDTNGTALDLYAAAYPPKPQLQVSAEPSRKMKARKAKKRGPFLDSDSEDEM